jgi:hypothetical protein
MLSGGPERYFVHGQTPNQPVARTTDGCVKVPLVEECAMLKLKKLHVLHPVVISILCFTSSAYGQAMRPKAEKKLAHDIYKEFVEIRSGYTTGSTTPVAEAAAARLRAA